MGEPDWTDWCTIYPIDDVDRYRGAFLITRLAATIFQVSCRSIERIMRS